MDPLRPTSSPTSLPTPPACSGLDQRVSSAWQRVLPSMSGWATVATTIGFLVTGSSLLGVAAAVSCLAWLILSGHDGQPHGQVNPDFAPNLRRLQPPSGRSSDQPRVRIGGPAPPPQLGDREAHAPIGGAPPPTNFGAHRRMSAVDPVGVDAPRAPIRAAAPPPGLVPPLNLTSIRPSVGRQSMHAPYAGPLQARNVSAPGRAEIGSPAVPPFQLAAARVGPPIPPEPRPQPVPRPAGHGQEARAPIRGAPIPSSGEASQQRAGVGRRVPNLNLNLDLIVAGRAARRDNSPLPAPLAPSSDSPDAPRRDARPPGRSADLLDPSARATIGRR